MVAQTITSYCNSGLIQYVVDVLTWRYQFISAKLIVYWTIGTDALFRFNGVQYGHLHLIACWLAFDRNDDVYVYVSLGCNWKVVVHGSGSVHSTGFNTIHSLVDYFFQHWLNRLESTQLPCVTLNLFVCVFNLAGWLFWKLYQTPPILTPPN